MHGVKQGAVEAEEEASTSLVGLVVCKACLETFDGSIHFKLLGTQAWKGCLAEHNSGETITKRDISNLQASYLRGVCAVWRSVCI